jgi:hypothetical protein
MTIAFTAAILPVKEVVWVEEQPLEGARKIASGRDAKALKNETMRAGRNVDTGKVH